MDNAVLMASPSYDLQLAPGRFAAECNVSEMGTSTFHVQEQERVNCPLCERKWGLVWRTASTLYCQKYFLTSEDFRLFLVS